MNETALHAPGSAARLEAHANIAGGNVQAATDKGEAVEQEMGTPHQSNKALPLMPIRRLQPGDVSVTESRNTWCTSNPSGPRIVKRTKRLSEIQMDETGRVWAPFRGRALAHNEVRALEWAREQGWPVPVVQAAWTDGECEYWVTEFVDGIRMDELAEEEAVKVFPEIEALLAKFQALKSRTMKSFVDEVCFPWRFQYGFDLKTPRYFKEAGEDEEQFVFCHGDLARHNIFVRKDDRTKIAGIIDWEYAGWYPAEVEYPFYLSSKTSGQQAAEMTVESAMLIQRMQARWIS